MDSSWLCFVPIILLMIPIIYFGSRSRMHYARRIREAQARGAFKDINTPKMKSRFRRLAVLALIGAVGMILSFLMLVQQWIHFPFSSDIFLAAILVFCLIAAIAGSLMQREINRRL